MKVLREEKKREATGGRGTRSGKRRSGKRLEMEPCERVWLRVCCCHGNHTGVEAGSADRRSTLCQRPETYVLECVRIVHSLTTEKEGSVLTVY